MTSLEGMLVIQLMQHKWDKHAPFPAFKTLAKRMGMCSASVRYHARSLEKKGYLRRAQREAQTTRFYLEPLFSKLETYMKDHPEKPKKRKTEEDAPAFDLEAVAVE